MASAASAASASRGGASIAAASFRWAHCEESRAEGGQRGAEIFAHSSRGDKDYAAKLWTTGTISDAVPDVDGSVTGACGSVLVTRNSLMWDHGCEALGGGEEGEEDDDRGVWRCPPSYRTALIVLRPHGCDCCTDGKMNAHGNAWFTAVGRGGGTLNWGGGELKLRINRQYVLAYAGGMPTAACVEVSTLPQGAWIRLAFDLPLGVTDVAVRKQHRFRDAISGATRPLGRAASLDDVSADAFFVDGRYVLPTVYFLLPFLLPTSYFMPHTSYFLLPTSYSLLPTCCFLLLFGRQVGCYTCTSSRTPSKLPCLKLPCSGLESPPPHRPLLVPPTASS